MCQATAGIWFMIHRFACLCLACRRGVGGEALALEDEDQLLLPLNSLFFVFLNSRYCFILLKLFSYLSIFLEMAKYVFCHCYEVMIITHRNFATALDTICNINIHDYYINYIKRFWSTVHFYLHIHFFAHRYDGCEMMQCSISNFARVDATLFAWDYGYSRIVPLSDRPTPWRFKGISGYHGNLLLGLISGWSISFSWNYRSHCFALIEGNRYSS